VLLLATVATLVLANSPVPEDFLSWWKTPVGISVGAFEIRHSLKHWVNEGLMVIFFFVVGLEVKRERIPGELRELPVAALPIAAALGGMVTPAALYLSFQWGPASAYPERYETVVSVSDNCAAWDGDLGVPRRIELFN